MEKIPFDEKELNMVETMGRRGPVKAFTYPVSERQAFLATYNKAPIYTLTGFAYGMFCPNIIPDNISRAFVIEADMIPPEKCGGADMFGVEWEYVPVAGGSMVKPGSPLMSDANEWEEKIKWPDIDKWDWEGCAKRNKKFLDNGKANMVWFLNGCWFERLISFMDFEGAVVALIDEEQQDAVKAIFERTTDLYCRIVDKFCEYFPGEIHGFTVHDDWGSQKASFFSPATGREMILPYMKKLVSHIHSKGLIADLHSCGHLENQAETFAEAGWDSWCPMLMNDTAKLYEKIGDKMVLSVAPESFDPASTPPKEQERIAREFVEKYPKAVLNAYCSALIASEPFARELYKYSRLYYLKN